MIKGRILTCAALAAVLMVATGCSERENAQTRNGATEGHGHDEASAQAHGHGDEADHGHAHGTADADVPAHEDHGHAHDDHGHAHEDHGHDHGAHAAPAPDMKVSEGAGSPEVKQQLGAIFQAYLPVQSALAADDAEKAEAALAALEKQVIQATAADVADPEDRYAGAVQILQESIRAMQEAENIAGMRQGFHKLSNELIASMKHFGYASSFTAHITHCPMAFDNKGADWLQADKQVLNPYYGEEMLHCGSVKGTI